MYFPTWRISRRENAGEGFFEYREKKAVVGLGGFEGRLGGCAPATPGSTPCLNISAPQALIAFRQGTHAVYFPTWRISRRENAGEGFFEYREKKAVVGLGGFEPPISAV